MSGTPARGSPPRRRTPTAHDALKVLIPSLIGVVWAVITVDFSLLLEIDWSTAPRGAVAVIAYSLQVILFWPSALLMLALRVMPLIGWQPGWVGLSLLIAACGGVPGALVGLVAFSWSRR